MDGPSEQITPRYYSRGRDNLGQIRTDLGMLQGTRALVAELVQNSDDAVDASQMSFVVSDEALTIWNNGDFARCDDLSTDECEWKAKDGHACDFHSFQRVAGGEKAAREDATGAFGIGFTAVYQITDLPVLRSSGEEWTIDETQPEHQRVQSLPVEVDGTTFILPWARENSYMRKELRIAPVDDALIEELEADLLDVVPRTMLFLHRLSRIDVSTRRKGLISFRRAVRDGLVHITGTDGHDERWLRLDGLLGDDARLLREQYPNQITPARPLEFALAIRVDEPLHEGHYFATLPTEQSTSLPLSLHGSFFPLPDRKQIRHDETPEGNWNATILRGAAALLAASLESVVEVVGDAWTIALLERARNLGRESQSGSLETAWWSELLAVLAGACVVPTAQGGRGTVGTVRLWNGEIEQDAASVLAQLDVDLVDPDFHAGWFGLRESNVGIRRLSLGDVAIGLAAVDATSQRSWVGGLSDADLDALWVLLNDLLSPGDQRNSKESRSAIARLLLVPTIDGGLRPIESSVKTVRGTVTMLADAAIGAPVLDLDFATRFPNIASQVRDIVPSDLVSWFENAFSADALPQPFDPVRILDWLAARPESLTLDHDRIRRLPIFPTGQGRQPLGHLALPGQGFKDPLGLATVLNLEHRPQQDGLRAFLDELGAEPLTLHHYCRVIVPQAVDSGLPDADIERLLAFLVDNYPRIEDSHDVRIVLRRLDLVDCRDCERRRGDEVYFDDVDRRLVGENHPTTVHSASPGRRRLLEWLGVASAPRHADVVARCLQLRDPPADHSDVVAAVLHHLEQFDRETFDNHYDRLRESRWLPVQDGEGPVRPKEVFASFRRDLFRSQAKFLGVSLGVQRSVSGTLDRLGVRANPGPEQVVAHLLWSVEHDAPVKDNLWNYLRDEVDEADEAALIKLRGRACIPLQKGDPGEIQFVRPDHCFWDENPFGTRYRYRLDDSFLRWRPVFDALGVRDAPDHRDAIDILGEIAYRHGGEDARLLTDDIEVVKQCWELLDGLLVEGLITSNDLEELRTTECVLGAAERLHRPDQVLFRDSSVLAEHFDDQAANRLIERPENMAVVLETVGVRHLREALRTDVVGRVDRPGSAELAQRISDRRLLIARALSTVGVSLQRIDSFLNVVGIVPLEELTVQEFLQLASTEHRTPGLERHALFKRDRGEFLVVEGDAPHRWSEVARELASGLDVRGEHLADAAIRLRTVLSATTPGDAEAELDELGFWRLDSALTSTVDAGSVSISVDETDDDDDLSPAEPGVGGEEAEPPAPPVPDVETVAGEHDADSDEQAPDVAPDDSTGGGQGGRIPRAPGPAKSGKESRSPDAPEPSSRGTATTGSDKQGGQRPDSPGQSRDRLNSYVAPRTTMAGGTEPKEVTERRQEVDRKAVDRVLEFERSCGRSPEEQAHDNEGFDVISTSPEGSKRYIEVKGTSKQWDNLGVGITSRQFMEAQRRTDEFWLYVVEVDDPNAEPFRIQDLASKIGKYFFDTNWRYLTETAERETRPLTSLPTVDERGDGSDLVPLLDKSVGTKTGQWVKVGEVADDGVERFAVQIAGDALGFAYRGGLVIAEPADVAEENDLVVGLLGDRQDPETGGPLFIRYWQPERAFDGSAIGLRLQSDGGVPPITLESLDDVEVLGVVRRRLRVDELSDG